jgi:hypothetical protein
LDIPIGAISEPDYHGSHKGETSFDKGVGKLLSTIYLHPQFLRGEEAQTFVGLLTELSAHYEWPRMKEILQDCYPVLQQDLEEVRALFAPEYLLPEVLRPFSKRIPIDSDKVEVAYLADKVLGMTDEEREKFEAVMEADSYCETLADVINTAANLDCFHLEAGVNAGDYGSFTIQNEGFELAEKIESRGYPEVAGYIRLLEEHFDHTAYGKELAEQENGKFTSQGYLTQKQKIPVVYRGPEDLPAEYRTSIKVENTDLAALLMEMYAVGGDYMRDAAHNVKVLANKGDDFIVIATAEMLTITPTDLLYRKDTDEHKAFMLMGRLPDVRTYYMAVTDRSGGAITGGIYETDLPALQNFSQQFGIATADEPRIALLNETVRSMIEVNRQPVAVSDFLSQLSSPYMAQAKPPQPNMLRVAPEAAKEILAQGTAPVFRLMPDYVRQLSPIDAIKVPIYQSFREFAVCRDDCAGIEKWAQRAVGDILRQNERGERAKTKSEEL